MSDHTPLTSGMAGKISPGANPNDSIRYIKALRVSLTGMILVILMLAASAGLPVFGLPPITSMQAYTVIVVEALFGVGYSSYLAGRLEQLLMKAGADV